MRDGDKAVRGIGVGRAARGVGGVGCGVCVGDAVGRGVSVAVGEGEALAGGAKVGDDGAVGVAVAATARVGSGPSSITMSPNGASYSGVHARSSIASSRMLCQTRNVVRTALTRPALALALALVLASASQ